MDDEEFNLRLVVLTIVEVTVVLILLLEELDSVVTSRTGCRVVDGILVGEVWGNVGGERSPSVSGAVTRLASAGENSRELNTECLSSSLDASCRVNTRITGLKGRN